MKCSKAVPLCLDETVRHAAKRLADKGIESPYLDARLLMEHVLHLDTASLIARGYETLSFMECDRFEALLKRRLAREPIALILRRKEFWGLSFEVSSDTLIPRPDSETLIEVALRYLGHRAQSKALRILDLGTGTGCLLLALLYEWPKAKGVGCDINAQAVELAARNARELGLSDRAAFLQSDWAAGIKGTFDLVIANPPYIPDSDIATLLPEVSQYEPKRALSGGEDGLDAYRLLANFLPRILDTDAHVILEVGVDQAETVRNLVFSGHRMRFLGMGADLAGIPRCVVGQNVN